jgi:hypothetical protein
MRTERDLATSLSHRPSIQGYRSDANKGDMASISDRLNIDLKHSWGLLVSLARKYREDQYSLMFLFAPMCYRYDIDMDLMRTILAFAMFDELASTKLPEYETYEHYRRGQCPNAKYLIQLVDPARVPPPHDEIEDMAEVGLSSKMQRQLRERKQKHERMSARGCEILVHHLLSQWPCAEPSTGDLDESLLVDIGRAMDVIRPEWKRLFENTAFDGHIDGVQKILTNRYTDEQVEHSGFVQDDQEPVSPPVHVRVVPFLEDLMRVGIQRQTKQPTQGATQARVASSDGTSSGHLASQTAPQSYSTAVQITKDTGICTTGVTNGG